MKLALASSVILLAAATSAMACPSYSEPGEPHEVTGPQLYRGYDRAIVAGGENDLTECELPGTTGTGFFTTTPDFSFYLSEMDGYDLEVSIEADGDCDTALLVNTPSATWAFDDDSAGNLQPILMLDAVGNGRLDVWVGTYSGDYCDAAIHLETWEH